MPTIKENETYDEWMSRCIPVVQDEKGYDQDQATAICDSMWEDSLDTYEKLGKIKGFKPIKLKKIT